MPAIGVGFPDLHIFCEHVGLIVLGIERDAEKHQVLWQPIVKTLLEPGEVVSTVENKSPARDSVSDLARKYRPAKLIASLED